MEKVEFELSEQSIDDLIAYIKGLSKRIDKVACEITKETLKNMSSKAKKNVSGTVGLTGYPPSGQLESSFVTHRWKNEGTLTNTDPNSAAVEFGTGIVGQSRPHPLQTEMGWKYDKNNHGESGWDYWSNGEKFHTYGQVAHRFMFNAIIDFQTSGDLEDIGIKAFNKYFGGTK